MTYGMNGWNKPDGDLISRQWLMECVKEGWIKFDTEKDENRFVHLVRDIAPSAQMERKKQKKGRWSGSCCSVCGVSRYNFINILHTDSGYRGTWKYCPNCGAEMEVR